LKSSTAPIDPESIKKLIPDVKVDAADISVDLDYQSPDEESSQEGVSGSAKKEGAGRTVKLDAAKKVVFGNKSEPIVIEESDEQPPAQPQAASGAKKPRVSVSLDLRDDDLEMPSQERERSPSPPKNDLSVYLHIENLVRPFTIGQLKGLVGKTGVISEDGFWINNIKSHCYVQLSSEEEATATREAMHGLKWPSGNPKNLKVDFAVLDKMFKETDGLLGEKSKVVVEIPDEEEDEESQKKRERKLSENRKSADKNVRNKSVKKDSPAKLLDDLFRKTKATPCIYWLPLSDEEIAKRSANNEAKENKAEREKSPVKRRSPERRDRSPERRTNNRRPNRGRR